jgi:hypothetical protein
LKTRWRVEVSKKSKYVQYKRGNSVEWAEVLREDLRSKTAKKLQRDAMRHVAQTRTSEGGVNAVTLEEGTGFQVKEA